MYVHNELIGFVSNATDQKQQFNLLLSNKSKGLLMMVNSLLEMGMFWRSLIWFDLIWFNLTNCKDNTVNYTEILTSQDENNKESNCIIIKQCEKIVFAEDITNSHFLPLRSEQQQNSKNQERNS